MVGSITGDFPKGWFHEKKKLFFCWILSKLPPPLQFGQLVPLFFNAKNFNLSDIQNDSLSKILLKLRQNICFMGDAYNLKTV